MNMTFEIPPWLMSLAFLLLAFTVLVRWRFNLVYTPLFLIPFALWLAFAYFAFWQGWLGEVALARFSRLVRPSLFGLIVTLSASNVYWIVWVRNHRQLLRQGGGKDVP